MSETLPVEQATQMLSDFRWGSGATRDKIRDQIRDLIEQRDALLAACNAVLNDDMASLRMVREAVAKATK